MICIQNPGIVQKSLMPTGVIPGPTGKESGQGGGSERFWTGGGGIWNFHEQRSG